MAALSQAERRQLRRLGVRIGAFALDLRQLLTADAASSPRLLAPGDARAEALRGRVRLGRRRGVALALEALAEALRAAPLAAWRPAARRRQRRLLAVGVESRLERRRPAAGAGLCAAGRRGGRRFARLAPPPRAARGQGGAAPIRLSRPWPRLEAAPPRAGAAGAPQRG